MRRTLFILLLLAMANLSTACMATRKYVRNEVKTSSDGLNARIEVADGEIAEVRDGVEGANSKISALDSKTGQRFDVLTGEVRTVDEKATVANNNAERATGAIITLDQKFRNRNQFTVAGEKSVYFKFNSSKLDSNYQSALDEIAEALTQNPDALVVMEGRTDAIGDKDYNFKLGERRIEAVKRYLAVEKGVPVYKLHHISFGPARPVASNDSREGREKNRAVTMMILVPRVEGAIASKNNN